MAESNCRALGINFITAIDNEEEMVTPLIREPFLKSLYYDDIIYVLLNLQAPPELSRTKRRFLKMKSLRFRILDNVFFWRDHEGILLNFLLKEKLDKVLQEFHVGDCGRHLY